MNEMALKKREEWLMETKMEKRDLSGRQNGTIDFFYGCFIWEEMMAYALNFSMPWSKFQLPCCVIF